MIETAGLESSGPHFRRVVPWKLMLAAAVVFVIAVALRIPSCFESLWVDELHSAWTIWEEWSEVQPRGRMGNQSPYYFWLLWLWRQVIGETEVALRLSSVLLNAAGCSLLVMGIYSVRRDLALGITAGLLLAVERSSIFFGTELRPYAAVVFLSVVLPVLCAGLSGRQPIWRRIALPLTAAALFLVHVTSLLAAAGILAMFLLSRFVKHRRRWASLRSGLLSLLTVAVAVGLAIFLERRALAALWSRRGQWEAFAVPRPINWDNPLRVNAMNFYHDISSMWPWLPMILLPLGLLIVVRLAGGRIQIRRWLPLVAALLLVTLVAYGLAALKISALWHRRYLVGLLPVLAWGSAELWFASIRGATKNWRKSSRLRVAIQGSTILLAVLVTAGWQGTTRRLVDGQFALAQRGEAWREAVAFIERRRSEEEPLTVDAGLIEANLAKRDPGGKAVELSDRFIDYLCCPVNNIYNLTDPRPMTGFSRAALHEILQARGQVEGSIWTIARVSSRQQRPVLEAIDRMVAAGNAVQASRGPNQVRLSVIPKRFAGVIVVRWDFQLIER